MSSIPYDSAKLADARIKFTLAWSSLGNSPEELFTVLNAAECYIKQLESAQHQLECRLAEHQVVDWPRIRHLPESERTEFSKWLNGQTRPLLNGLPYEEQDAYYPWDYESWHKSLKGIKVAWD